MIRTPPDQLMRELAAPFATEDVEWRIQRSGLQQNGGQPWAMVIAYVTNRAIMQRLDEVCGIANWRNDYKAIPSHDGLLCGISLLLPRISEGKEVGEWVTKWDGSGAVQVKDSGKGLTASEAVKGSISAAMKRAAVLWGVGRYLYSIPEGFATFVDEQHKQGAMLAKIENRRFWWKPPALPKEFLPTPMDSRSLGDRDRRGTAPLDPRLASAPESVRRVTPPAQHAARTGQHSAAPNDNDGWDR